MLLSLQLHENKNILLFQSGLYSVGLLLHVSMLGDLAKRQIGIQQV